MAASGFSMSTCLPAWMAASAMSRWVPAGVAVGWRPYWDGRWVLTEYGWTFVSDDPWGWATWHYGNVSYSQAVHR